MTILRKLIAISMLSGAGIASAHAAERQSNVVCSYHHTAGDDAIMMHGMPGMAMLHYFFGNTSVDAFSNYNALLAHPQTTCDNKSDASAYWVPSLRMEDGELLKPSYQKTYYQADDVAAHPVQPFPPGLELLAGDHHGSKPPKNINFLCAGQPGYFNKIGRVCTPRSPGGPVQFNIGMRFPNCWDGKNLRPAVGKPNATYAVNNICPTDFPVKLPTVNLNAVWVLPGIKALDTSKVGLSMDPEMHHGHHMEKWGNLYTAHGDFMNGWTVDGARFMTEHCLNRGTQCGLNVPYSMSAASESSYVDSRAPTAIHAQDAQMHIVDNWNGAGRDMYPQKLALLKFTIPALPSNLPPEDAALFKYTVRLHGKNTTDSAARILHIYAADNSWQASSVNWNHRPPMTYTSVATLRHGNKDEDLYFDVDNYVRQQAAAGNKEVSFYIGGERHGREFVFDSATGKVPPLLLTEGTRETPQP